MVEGRKGGIEASVMIEDSASTINIEGRAEFLCSLCKIDIFAVKLPALIPKRMHR
jgi:hypothetical protein